MIDSRILELMSQEVASGMSIADSRYVTDAESKEMWESLKATYDSLKESDTVMAIPSEWDNTDYEVGSLYGDTFYADLDALIAENQTSVEKMALAAEDAEETADQTKAVPGSDAQLD